MMFLIFPVRTKIVLLFFNIICYPFPVLSGNMGQPDRDLDQSACCFCPEIHLIPLMRKSCNLLIFRYKIKGFQKLPDVIP